MDLLDARPESFKTALVLAVAWAIGTLGKALITHWRTRVPLKRANDLHIEHMLQAQTLMSRQQERTATAVEGVATLVQKARGDLKVLLDRGK